MFKKLATAARVSTTYRIGLLQAKAYRILKAHTAEALKHFKISTIEWAFLGLLHDHKDGMRAQEAAEELGVEAPFVSALLRKLEKKKLLSTHPSPDDSRAKIVHLTREGRSFVDGTEKHLRGKMRPLVQGAAITDLLAYLTVLETIIENANKQK